jgi:hypothetical protein
MLPLMLPRDVAPRCDPAMWPRAHSTSPFESHEPPKHIATLILIHLPPTVPVLAVLYYTSGREGTSMLGCNGDLRQPGSAIAKENILAPQGRCENSLKHGINYRTHFQLTEGYLEFKFTSQGGPAMLGCKGDFKQPGSAIAKENKVAPQDRCENSLKHGINYRTYFQSTEGYLAFKFISQGGSAMLGCNGDQRQPGSAIAKENKVAPQGCCGNSLKIGINSRAYFQPTEGYLEYKFTYENKIAPMPKQSSWLWAG